MVNHLGTNLADVLLGAMVFMKFSLYLCYLDDILIFFDEEKADDYNMIYESQAFGSF